VSTNVLLAVCVGLNFALSVIVVISSFADRKDRRRIMGYQQYPPTMTTPGDQQRTKENPTIPSPPSHGWPESKE